MVRKIIIFGALIALATCAVASGIRVSPGAFCAQNIDIGRDLDLGVDLTIDNNSDSRQSFCVSPIKPSQAKASWLKGYSEIPDPNWLYFSDSRIEVEPRSSGRVRMKLKIPNDKKYLNQRWIVFVNIANEIKKGEMLGVSIKPNYMFETRSDKINVRPAGIIGFNPSNINVAASPGKSQTVSFTLFNNDKKKIEKFFDPVIHVVSRGIEQKIIKNADFHILAAFIFYPILAISNSRVCLDFELTDQYIETAFTMAWDAIRL